jgi:hypothetical protein
MSWSGRRSIGSYSLVVSITPILGFSWSELALARLESVGESTLARSEASGRYMQR